ncbi:MAG: CDP-archaeol synthase, partial [archaeon]
MSKIIELLVEALLYIFPAYVANSSAVVLGGGKPLDNGKKYKGKRILGDGKTIRGTVFGIVCGFLVGLIIYLMTK